MTLAITKSGTVKCKLHCGLAGEWPVFLNYQIILCHCVTADRLSAAVLSQKKVHLAGILSATMNVSRWHEKEYKKGMQVETNPFLGVTSLLLKG